MATVKTKADLYDLANERARIWKSLTLNNGDVLVTGLKDVWLVSISDSTKWAAGGWTVGTGTTAGQVTFNLTGAFTGRVYVIGR
jgi:hypothetical protein